MSAGTYKKDILISVKYGLLVSTACALVLFLGGFLFGGFSPAQAVSVLRSGMCIISGLSLFVIAGAILTRRNEMIKSESKWREKFVKLGYVGVLGTVSVCFIIWAAVSDALLRLIGS